MPSISIKTAAFGLAAALSAPVSAFWRMPCPGRLTLQRIDPLIFPGVVSPHVHTVSGGSGFGFETSYEQQIESACSSCPIKADLSAYWTPKLYWTNEDYTEFEDVPQAGEADGTTGGLIVYYEQRPGPKNDNLTAFPAGLRFVAGDPFQRTPTGAQAAPGQAVSFACLNYNAPPTPETGYMPNVNCPDGLRAQVYFPSCWDGIHNDTADHKSHMAYPIGGKYDNGYCPESHPVHLVSIFYEVIYSTSNFADRWWNPHKHPFVFAQGDRTGYGFHGDFVNGWNVSVLQDAVDNCNADSGNISDCPYFDDLFTGDECQACKIPPQVHEQVTGNLTKLPGCNQVTGAGKRAPIAANCPTTPIGAPQQYFTDKTSSGWKYVGCASDSTDQRTFQGADSSGDDMTVEKCIKFCKDAGFSLAGLEWSTQCYCDNKYYDDDTGSRAPQPNILGDCWQPCAGNAKEVCGGAAALSVYKNCNGGACENDVFHVNGTAAGGYSRRKRHLHKHAHGHAKL